MFSPGAAWGLNQQGISDDRVSLPEGPGSLEGVGENVEVAGNMGLMHWNLPLEVPSYFTGMAPELSLTYGSGGSNSVVGMGWSLDIPAIERSTLYGLPVYDDGDDFVMGSGSLLVRLPGEDDSGALVYRERLEHSFNRYKWHDREAGEGGYWTVEYPDGRVGTFGADSSGEIVPSSRFFGSGGVFRYLLAEMVDVFGHRTVYTYGMYGGAHGGEPVPLIESIEYSFDDGGDPRYRVEFTYEPRQDGDIVDLLSDCKSGVNELLEHRLAAVTVYSFDQQVREYRLTYDDYTSSGGFTRLMEVEQFGAEGDAFPIHFTFQYSQALGGVCAQEGPDCRTPFMVSMGNLSGGVDIRAGNATLIDMNGDAMPDIVDSTLDGAHRIYLSVLEADGSHHFEGPHNSEVGTSGGHRLTSPYVQVLDINGDGFADLVNALSGDVLLNRGGGDWEDDDSAVGISQLPTFDDAGDDSDTEPDHIRFFDYDNDKHIDVIRSLADSTMIYRNCHDCTSPGFVPDDDVSTIGWGFSEHRMQFADMNGDGLLDPVVVFPGFLSYRLNLGWGQWGEQVDVTLDLGVDAANLRFVELEDLNGDGLADASIVLGNKVTYALSRNGTHFLPVRTLTSDDVEGTIPTRTDSIAVLLADMNGNGSTDVVWVDNTDGSVEYLELFPVRPNLLSRIENGLGMVTEITYGTSVQHMARDQGAGRSWLHPLPMPMVVVDRMDTWDELTDVHEVTDYTYHDGFYDGFEKQYRGYEAVEVALEGDESQEEGLTEQQYDVGATDPYYNGLLLHEAISSAGRRIHEETPHYDDCPLTGVPEPSVLEAAGQFAVRYICEVGRTTVFKEGAPESQWLTVDVEYEYDGYGNRILESELGVTAAGDGTCDACDRDASVFGRPCGPSCVGDERYTERAFVDPTDISTDRWMLHNVYRERVYGRPDSNVYSERLTYYDGDPFEGLPLGELTEGRVSLITARVEVGSEEVIAVERNRHDEDGNIVEQIDPNGEVGGQTHRRFWTYDEDGLHVIRTEVLLEDEEGAYRLRRDYQYDLLFRKLIEATSWMIVEGGAPPTQRNSTFFSYDQFGLLASMVLPGGDTLTSPTQALTFELGNPVSRVTIAARSRVGGELDLERIQCFDGRGRLYQERTRVSESEYLVTGFRVFNKRGAERRLYQPYTSTSDACDQTEPTGIRQVTTRYDAAYRAVLQVMPDADQRGEASTVETVYEPLAVLVYDEEDSDGSSPHNNTPTVQRTDGLDRVWAIERTLEAGGEPAVVELTYDELGNLRGYLDAQGNEKVQLYDLLGRVGEVSDPNTGTTTYTYDDAGNLIEEVDARGVVVHTDFDGANRRLQRWDGAERDGTLIEWTYDRAADCAPVDCSFTAGQLAGVAYPLRGLDDPNAVGVERYGYDPRGRQIYDARTLEDFTFETRYALDNMGRLLSTTYPDGREIERRYDDASRLVAVEGFVDEIAYDERGLTATIAFANGTTNQRDYDARMSLSALRTTGPDDAVLLDLTHERDRVGNIVGITDGREVDADEASATASYTYDAWYRLVEGDLDAGRATQETLNYSYDLIENILGRTSSLGAASPEHVGEYEYGAFGPNAVEQAGALAMTYDQAGHETGRGNNDMAWDYLGRLTDVTRGTKTVTRSVYGADEMRVMRLRGDHIAHYLGGDFEVQDGIGVLYVRIPILDLLLRATAGGSRVARIESDRLAAMILTDLAPQGDADGQITVADAWLAHAADQGIVAVEGAHSPVSRLLTSSVRRLLMQDATLHQDHLGSAILATDEDGEALGRTQYYPFGTSRETAGYVDEYGFTGQLADASGLMHFQFRTLDVSVGRWLSADPLYRIATPGAIGRVDELTVGYAYVANNPVTTFDPLGLRNGKEGGGRAVPMKRARVPVAHRVQVGMGPQHGPAPAHAGHAVPMHPAAGPAAQRVQLGVGAPAGPAPAPVGQARPLHPPAGPAAQRVRVGVRPAPAPHAGPQGPHNIALRPQAHARPYAPKLAADIPRVAPQAAQGSIGAMAPQEGGGFISAGNLAARLGINPTP
ncbi:MAG: hypothetical protein JW797_14065 [Bradymonadales bacterium]|nr:hypothetical protein [Bradymonadales bacterium]